VWMEQMVGIMMHRRTQDLYEPDNRDLDSTRNKTRRRQEHKIFNNTLLETRISCSLGDSDREKDQPSWEFNFVHFLWR
jgi:hypothetical protein